LSPSNFLAVTFSKKAAEEMLSRVEMLIGEHKDELWISTFHSFCHRILKDHALDGGLSRNFRLLDRTEQWMFFKTIIPRLNLRYYRNLADPMNPVHDFLRFISRCKDELLSPDAYRAYVEGIEDVEQRARQQEMTDVYAAYQDALAEANCLDFGDLITRAIALFQKRPEILSRYQEQFHYILVDEFQDTNIAQIELVTLLASKRKNICVVGDDDQGIYRFRGASYASFVKFKEVFPGLTSLRLTQNYRSTKKILSVSESLIQNNNPDRYDPQKNLWTDRAAGSAVHVISTNDYDGEAAAVADAIKEIGKNQKDYAKIAVLYRAHSHNQAFIKRLKLEGIPYTVAGPMGLFEREEIKDLVALLTVLANPHDNVNLFRVLSLPPFAMDIRQMVKLNKMAREEERSLYELIREESVLGRLSKTVTQNIREANKMISHCIALAHKVDVETLFYELLERTGYAKNLLVGLDAESEVKLATIGKLYRLINEYLQRHEDGMLPAFMEYLTSYIQAGGDVLQETAFPEDKSGVQLMTIHQAKGLEFPYVFVISLVQNRFPTRARPDAIPFPVALMKEELPKGNFHLQEERRLFYVAVTRAKEQLFLSTVNKPYHKESVFLREIQAETSKEALRKTYTEYDNLEAAQEVALGIPQKTLRVMKSKRKIVQAIERLERAKTVSEALVHRTFGVVQKEYRSLVATLKQQEREASRGALSLAETHFALPEHLKLSYTQLDTFLSCPLKYKFNYVYHIPMRPSAPLSFGAVIHDVLEEFYRRIKEEKVPTEEELYDIYSRRWDAKGYINRSQEMQYQQNGFELLKQFYETNREHWEPPLYIEEKFLITIGDCQFKGYIDRVDELPDGGVEIIDYKTGTPKDQRAVEKSIQLDLYAIACQEILGLEPRVLSFYFLTNNQKISATRLPEDLERTKGFILETVDKMRSGHFEPNPGRRCRWCDYRIICPAAKL
jgi:DNA helicase-2/ATP-dependent DNA helicase PcrA